VSDKDDSLVALAWHELVRAGLHRRVDVRTNALGSTFLFYKNRIVLDSIERPHALVGVDLLVDVVPAARRLLGET